MKGTQDPFLAIRRCNTRSLAGNPDSPQAVVFLTSIIDEIVGVATDYADYHAISHWNTSALRSAKPGQWLSGQTSRGASPRLGIPHHGRGPRPNRGREQAKLEMLYRRNV